MMAAHRFRPAVPRSRRLAGAVLLSLVIGGPLAACAGGGGSYVVKADFSRTIGLYPGSYVRELGIGVGSVTQVVNQAGGVEVTMRVSKSHPISAGATATIVGESVLGERYVQLAPPYHGGPRLASGATIPLSRTTVPVETDDVLRSLQKFLGAVDPNNARDAVANLAALLAGQGNDINSLIAHASGTVSLLAEKSNDLGQLVTTLAQLSTALDSRTNDISKLVRDYATVAAVLAANNQQLGQSVTHLADAAQQASGLLDPNLGGIKDDVAALTTAGRTLDRNMDSLDTTIAATPALFSAAQRAYDPQHNWLPLNTQSDVGTTQAVFKARIRDTLASVCRRLQAKSGTPNPTLQTCGDPNSGFFDPILGLAAGSPSAPSSSPSSAAGALAAGLALIPGVPPGAASATPAGANPTTTSSTSTTVPPTTTTLLPDPSQLLGPKPPLHAAPGSANPVTRLTAWAGRVLAGLW